MLPEAKKTLGDFKAVIDPFQKKETAASEEQKEEGKEEGKEMSKAQMKKLAKQAEIARKKAEKAGGAVEAKPEASE